MFKVTELYHEKRFRNNLYNCTNQDEHFECLNIIFALPYCIYRNTNFTMK